jgi:protein KRI1
MSISPSYILNRGWIDRSSRRVPTFAEVTSKRKARSPVKPASPINTQDIGSESSQDKDGENLLEEDDFDDVADNFEASYNFRFEEP